MGILRLTLGTLAAGRGLLNAPGGEQRMVAILRPCAI